ncbi:unnamed protein product [Arabidopsis halleri]
MAQRSTEPKVSLRLIIDEEKNKVVLAEAGKDFVQVLFSFLTLPMGTIVRLLGKHQVSEPVTVGCISNLYTSVVDMKIDDFETEACKQMLLYPRNYVREAQCRKFKLNINPTESFKCFGCSSFPSCSMCSNFNTSRCRCGKLMTREIDLLEDEEVIVGIMQNDLRGVFIRDRSSFIITDDLKLTVDSTSSLLQTLKDLGFSDVSKLRERVLDIGLKEVLTLLQCVFSSNSPLTDTFLKNQSLHKKRLSPCLEKNGDEAEQDKVITFDAIVRKQDMKILYVECGEDFVDLLLTFLAIPLESIWEVSGNHISLGCVGNLSRSFKDLSDNERTQVSDPKFVLPYYYGCQNQLLNIITFRPQFYVTINRDISRPLCCMTTKPTFIQVSFIDPKYNGHHSVSTEGSGGFMKRDSKFTVSDDLVIAPKNTTSTFSTLKKLQIHTNDIEVQKVSISKAHALNLLRALVVTSSALSFAFGNLIVKKPKEENVSWNPVSKKLKVET